MLFVDFGPSFSTWLTLVFSFFLLVYLILQYLTVGMDICGFSVYLMND